MGKQEIYVDEATKQLLQEFENAIRESIETVFASLDLGHIIDQGAAILASQDSVSNSIKVLLPTFIAVQDKQLGEITNAIKSHHDVMQIRLDNCLKRVNEVLAEQIQARPRIASIKAQCDRAVAEMEVLRKEIQAVASAMQYLVIESKSIQKWERMPWYKRMVNRRDCHDDPERQSGPVR